MSPFLAEAAWPEVTSTGLLLVPVGSIEQHGPHLPLNTDAVIARAVATRTAARVPGAWIAPPVFYAASGEHQDFPGTSSIGTEALRLTIVELVRSVRTWAARVFFVNAHGGNQQTIEAAVGQLIREGHDVGWAPCSVPGGDPHAGYAETSLMLHLQPTSVRLDRLEAGNMHPLREIWSALREGGVKNVSENGVLGDPRKATAEEGSRLLTLMTDSVVALLQRGDLG